MMPYMRTRAHTQTQTNSLSLSLSHTHRAPPPARAHTHSVSFEHEGMRASGGLVRAVFLYPAPRRESHAATLDAGTHSQILNPKAYCLRPKPKGLNLKA